LNADVTLIGRYESDLTFTYLAVVGDHEPVSDQMNRPVGGDNLVTNMVRSGHPESMSYDMATGPIADFARQLGIHCAVGTPIVVGGRTWGAMLAGWTKTQDCSADAVRRIADITELVATNIANAESRAALIESRARVVAAGDETRRRIGRDIHDGAQQRLVTLALKLQSIEEPVPPEIARLLDEMASGIQEVMQELRELANGLRPPMLSEKGLKPALKVLARRAPLPVQLQVRVSYRLPEPIEVAVYYVVAEALTNVAKHAHASAAEVEVTAGGETLAVTVSDNGIGGADPSRGSGLLGLHDRLEALGGTIPVTSRSAGTVITASVPISPPTTSQSTARSTPF
jgi:signal transduction histidine kinase